MMTIDAAVTLGFVLYFTIVILLMGWYASSALSKRRYGVRMGLEYPHETPVIHSIGDAMYVLRDVREYQRAVAASADDELTRLRSTEQRRFRLAAAFLVGGLSLPALAALAREGAITVSESENDGLWVIYGLVIASLIVGAAIAAIRLYHWAS